MKLGIRETWGKEGNNDVDTAQGNNNVDNATEQPEEESNNGDTNEGNDVDTTEESIDTQGSKDGKNSLLAAGKRNGQDNDITNEGRDILFWD